MQSQRTTFQDFARGVQSVWTAPNLVLIESLDSTNRIARRIAETMFADHSAVQPTWILGFEQTAGRGRLGRSWASNKGMGIYATLLWPLDSEDDASALLRLPIATGVATCHASRAMVADEQASEAMPGLKWPNDVLVSGKKLGGILIEAVESPQGRCAIIGIGLNHGFGQDALPDPKAVSLRMLCATGGSTLPTLNDCAVLLCNTVLDELQSGRSLPDLMAEYEQLSVHRRGDRLQWGSSKGPVQGVFEGFDEVGCILLRTESGLVTVSAGDVLLTADPRDA